MKAAAHAKAGGRHLAFRTLADLLPANGTREAKGMSHLLRCDRCTDAALAILLGSGMPPPAAAYEGAVERAAEKAFAALRRALEWERQAEALATELARLSPRGQRAKVRALARERPWEVAGALLSHGRRIVATSPGLARHLAGLAGLALAAIPPEDDPDGVARLQLERSCLTAGAAIHLGALGEAEAALAGAAARLFSRAQPQDRAVYCFALAALRRAQGRLDEDLGLLLRAAELFRQAGDDGGVLAALAAAEEVTALLEPAPRPRARTR